MPNTSTGTAVYRLHPAVAIEDFGPRSLILHCTTLHLIELNATARDILSRLDGQVSLVEVAQAMAGEYDQPTSIILADVQALVSDMLSLEIVERIPSQRSPQHNPDEDGGV